MKHGKESFYIDGEGLINEPLFPEKVLSGKNIPRGVCPGDVKLESGEQRPKPTRKFCRLFKKGDRPSAESLIALGKLMETETKDPNDNRNSNIPAGYTYLGQFISHDITFDLDTELTTDGQVEPGDIKNFRTPSLDLDSLYLSGPEKNQNPELYESDGRTFKIGITAKVGNLPEFRNDLPRKGGFTNDNYIAVIGDPRNDENLALAQTHLAFLKFHNAIAAASPEKCFCEIRREVTLHYQAIILTDFLPRILDREVLNDVLQNGRRFYTDEKKDCMPIEFSVAAYRIGHSMVRPCYNFNRIHKMATLKELFEFSGVSGSSGEGDLPFNGNVAGKLPSDWITDWCRFYDFSEVGGEKHKEEFNYARKLDAKMAMDLNKLPEFIKKKMDEDDPLVSLATRNLLRGRLVCLPSGQEVAAALEETPLTAEDLLSNVEVTPLWYYILREAMVQANGNHLGKVGSRIVAETFVGLIENSRINIISEQPELCFSMPKLLMEIKNDINPLGKVESCCAL